MVKDTPRSSPTKADKMAYNQAFSPEAREGREKEKREEEEGTRGDEKRVEESSLLGKSHF